MLKAERKVQPPLTILLLVQMLILFGAILGAREIMQRMPDRVELGSRRSPVAYRPIHFDPKGFGPFELAGAWTISNPDPRFGGFSGLELDRGKLLAVGDNGGLAWLDKPGPQSASVLMRDLPDGPGDRRFKSDRDAEAIRADPAGRGWWVPFENANQVWLYNRNFSAARGKVDFGESRWPINDGIEGLIADRDELKLFVENEKSIFSVRGKRLMRQAVAGRRWRISEAIRLADGRIIAVERTLGWSGFRNALVSIDRTKSGYRVRSRTVLPLGAFDNIEGLAAEQVPRGAMRLWLIADDNFERPMRTLLVALDLPTGKTP